MEDQLVTRSVRVDEVGAVIEALCHVSDYGLAGYGIISARPSAEPGYVILELGEQPETVVAQVRVKVRDRLKRLEEGGGASP